MAESEQAQAYRADIDYLLQLAAGLTAIAENAKKLNKERRTEAKAKEIWLQIKDVYDTFKKAHDSLVAKEVPIQTVYFDEKKFAIVAHNFNECIKFIEKLAPNTVPENYATALERQELATPDWYVKLFPLESTEKQEIPPLKLDKTFYEQPATSRGGSLEDDGQRSLYGGTVPEARGPTATPVFTRQTGNDQDNPVTTIAQGPVSSSIGQTHQMIPTGTTSRIGATLPLYQVDFGNQTQQIFPRPAVASQPELVAQQIFPRPAVASQPELVVQQFIQPQNAAAQQNFPHSEVASQPKVLDQQIFLPQNMGSQQNFQVNNPSMVIPPRREMQFQSMPSLQYSPQSTQQQWNNQQQDFSHSENQGGSQRSFIHQSNSMNQQRGMSQTAPAGGLDIRSIVEIVQEASRSRDPPSYRASYRSNFDIPEFHGDIRKYQYFKETFITLTRGAPDIERLSLLKSKLKGSAQNQLDTMTVTATNYDLAWSALDQRYGNPRYILAQELKSLNEIKPLRANNLEEFEQLILSVRGFFANVNALGFPKSYGEAYIVSTIEEKLDLQMRTEYERELKSTMMFATADELLAILDRRLQILQAAVNSQRKAITKATQQEEPRKDSKRDKRERSHQFIHMTTGDGDATVSTKKAIKCFVCSGEHGIEKCTKFLEAKSKDEMLRHYKVCVYCLRHKYNFKQPCRKRLSVVCDVCHQNHHTLLHHEQAAKPTEGVQTTVQAVTVPTSTIKKQPKVDGTSKFSPAEVVLPTGYVHLLSAHAGPTLVRCMIDSGSQSTAITQKIARDLKLKRVPTKVDVYGAGGELVTTIKEYADIKLQLEDGSIITTRALIMKKVSPKLPSRKFDIPKEIQREKLADPEFNNPSEIHLILGSNIAPEIYTGGAKIVQGMLLQSTRMGWLVQGPVHPEASSAAMTDVDASAIKQLVAELIKKQAYDRGDTYMGVTASINSDVTMEEWDNMPHQYWNNIGKRLVDFWDLPVSKEEISNINENYCEKIFNEKTYQREDGTYVVPIPWIEDSEKLGDSYTKAAQIFLSLERRCRTNAALKEKSDAFMKEYLELKHMEKVPRELHGDRSGKVFYLPWHSILKADSLTTKCRNVFNGSAITTSGISLNHIIHPGPALQTRIPDVLTAVRCFKYMFSADVSKMFRNIAYTEEDSHRIRILWRADPTEPLDEYRLLVVTYGVDCSPWQATRLLWRIADDHAPNELTKQIVRKAFYVDDLAYGGHSIEQCRERIQHIDETLAKGKMILTKWMSNEKEVLSDINPERRIESYLDKDKQHAPHKLLGVHYDPETDCFTIKVPEFPKIAFTKRGIASVTASIYDPLGLILPVSMKFRITQQTLWLKKLDWDDLVDEDYKKNFQSLVNTLPDLAKMSVRRWIGTDEHSPLQLIGFSDASGDGFAAVVYARVKVGNTFQVTLVNARGRVTPLKTKENLDTKLCTIPKMELEGLLLLTELLEDTKKNFENVESITAYTDSEVVLAWVRNEKEIQDKFVKRRVTKIRKVLKPFDLNWVKSAENPADAASRGLSASELAQHSLWFNGPEWLTNDEIKRTPFTSKAHDDDETFIFTITTDKPEQPDRISAQFSKFSQHIRGVALCRRLFTHPKGKRSFPWTVDELQEAKNIIMKNHQKQEFPDEINRIKDGKGLPKRHPFNKLDIFLHAETNLLCVGGRITRAEDLPDCKRHPILLRTGDLVDAIIRETHQRHGHAGNRLVESIIREEYYIPQLQRRIKKILRQCVVCNRLKGKVVQQKMGDLPSERIQSAPAFYHTGVDYAGPFTIKESPLRHGRTMKVYVAVFVCMSTKMFHLEVVGDLSTDGFLAALSRMIYRRGNIATLYSDQGRNFMGADKVLKNAWDNLTREAQIALAKKFIRWLHSPVYTPNFGGLYEAGVKALKYFLKRMATVTKLSYENFTTLTCNIEALLNSRPMCPLSDDVTDLSALTPAHFALQRSIISPIIEMGKIRSEATPATKRWLEVQELQRHFWKKYQSEYLVTLQKRHKWNAVRRNAQVNDLVLIKDLTSEPLDWKLGRITSTLPDHAGIVRSVVVRTADKPSQIQATSRLVPLIHAEEQGETIDRRTKRSQPMPSDEPKPPKQPKTCPGKKPTAKAKPIDAPTDKTSPELPGPSSGRVTRSAARQRKEWMHLLMFAICCLLTGANASTITPIEGIHIENLREISLKAQDISFKIKTNVNFANDTDIIRKNLDDFTDFCHTVHNFTKIQEGCFAMKKLVHREFDTIKTTIMNGLTPTRTRRSGAAVGAFVFRAIPHAITAVTIGYLTYENNKLNQRISELENHIVKVTRALTSLHNIEATAIDKNLDALINQQRQLKLEQQVNTYAIGLQNLVLSFRLRHQELDGLQLMTELRQFVEKYDETLNLVTLPENVSFVELTAGQIPKKTLVNQFIHLEYTIPLVYRRKFTEYAFISTPSKEQPALLWSNSEQVEIKAYSENNLTYFSPKPFNEIYPGTYEAEVITSWADCATQFIRMIPPTNCIPQTSFSYSQQFSLAEGVSVIIVNPNKSGEIILHCPDKEERMQTSVIIRDQDPSCNIKFPTQNNSKLINQGKADMKTNEETLILINDTIATFQTPPEIEIIDRLDITEQRRQLEAEIDDQLLQIQFDSIIHDSQPWGYIAVVFLIIITIIISCNIWWKRRHLYQDNMQLQPIEADQNAWSMEPPKPTLKRM